MSSLCGIKGKPIPAAATGDVLFCAYGTVIDLHRTISVIFDRLDLDFSSAHDGGDSGLYQDAAEGLERRHEYEIEDGRGFCASWMWCDEDAIATVLRQPLLEDLMAVIEALFPVDRLSTIYPKA